jgi:hypothetical protein
MKLLPERKTGEAWELSKKQYCFGRRASLDRKVLLRLFNAVPWLQHMFADLLENFPAPNPVFFSVRAKQIIAQCKFKNISCL